MTKPGCEYSPVFLRLMNIGMFLCFFDFAALYAGLYVFIKLFYLVCRAIRQMRHGEDKSETVIFDLAELSERQELNLRMGQHAVRQSRNFSDAFGCVGYCGNYHMAYDDFLFQLFAKREKVEYIPQRYADLRPVSLIVRKFKVAQNHVRE